VIDLAKLPPEGLRIEGVRERVDLEGKDGIRDLRWNLFVLPSNSDVFLETGGEAIWEGCCSRCLEPFDMPLRVESQFLGSKDPDLVARGSRTLGTQDLDVVFLPEPFLDEEALVVEQFHLHIPMHPLCKEDCLGLCPQCGKNWNKGRCACPPVPEKEPSALAKALSRLNLDLAP
jgi:uncharacterized protein